MAHLLKETCFHFEMDTCNDLQIITMGITKSACSYHVIGLDTRTQALNRHSQLHVCFENGMFLAQETGKQMFLLK